MVASRSSSSLDIQGYESDSTIVAEAGGADDDAVSIKKKPFPAVQLFLICLVQFAEPITASVLYPFITEMVWHTGVTRGDKTRIGYFSGAIETAFLYAECLTVLRWGSLADRIGRRRVLLFGPFGAAISIFALGMSNDYWVIILARSIQGICNGSISGVGKTMLVEITDPLDVPRAFSWVPAFWGAGITIGPVIGGTLADAATKWPETFGRFGYLAEHPYFLPCAVVGSLAFLVYLLAWCFLRDSSTTVRRAPTQEVNRRRHHKRHADSRAPLLANGELNSRTYDNTPSAKIPAMYDTRKNLRPETSEKSESNLRFLSNRSLLVALINYALTSFFDQCFLVLIALMFSTSIEEGGLGLDPFAIGIIMGGWGMLNAIFQFVMFPRVINWLGPKKMYIICFSGFVFMFAGFPLLSFFAKRAGKVDWIVICVLVLQMSFFSIVYMSYACAQLFVLAAAPAETSLMGMNSLSQAASTLARGSAGTVASSLFSLSLQEGLGGGSLVYGVLMGATLVGVYLASKSPSHFRTQKY